MLLPDSISLSGIHRKTLADIPKKFVISKCMKILIFLAKIAWFFSEELFSVSFALIVKKLRLSQRFCPY